MLEACNEAGNEYNIISSYRDRNYQQGIIDDTVQTFVNQGMTAEEAYAEAIKSVQPAGCSEPETGLATDYIVEGDELKSVAAGTGKGNPVTGGGLNYPLLLKLVKEHKPYVHCTLENTVPDNAVATREFMERTYASV